MHLENIIFVWIGSVDLRPTEPNQNIILFQVHLLQPGRGATHTDCSII